MRKRITTSDYVQGVLANDRAMLGRAITLVESEAERHMAQAQAMLQELLPHSGRSIRIGITGVPGVGKSTFIERFGVYLIEQGYRVAVLAIDPSSSLSRGSILGDKTRMEELTRLPEAFIRPSPTGGTLGGVARKTRESIVVCEAAGFDIILVETVGVGQSEIAARSMVDMFLLLLITGAGDELQALKKGIVEIADALIITKADGDNRTRAIASRADYLRALRYLAPVTNDWKPQVLTCSALTGEGMPEILALIKQFVEKMRANGQFDERRKKQALSWLHTLISEALKRRFYGNELVNAQLQQTEQAVLNQQLSPGIAAEQLLALLE